MIFTVFVGICSSIVFPMGTVEDKGPMEERVNIHVFESKIVPELFVKTFLYIFIDISVFYTSL